jgi:hypothetical protein
MVNELTPVEFAGSEAGLKFSIARLNGLRISIQFSAKPACRIGTPEGYGCGRERRALCFCVLRRVLCETLRKGGLLMWVCPLARVRGLFLHISIVKQSFGDRRGSRLRQVSPALSGG